MVRRRVASGKMSLAVGLRQCIRPLVESMTPGLDGHPLAFAPINWTVFKPAFTDIRFRIGFHSANSNSISSRRGSAQILQTRECRSLSVGPGLSVFGIGVDARSREACSSANSIVLRKSFMVNCGTQLLTAFVLPLQILL